ncbi:HNH endonuclease [Candidatus Pacearchaeota archaeon]|nr:HNH endonuclease [Candidatus Pacearchaeota archaeon]
MHEIQRSPWHYQFIGKVTVNFYPSKNKAYVNGMHKSFPCSRRKAIRIADDPSLIEFHNVKKDKRKNNMRKMRHKLYDRGVTDCYVCGEYMEFEETTLEHIIPLDKGGANREDNYSLSHESCNMEKGNSI